MELPKDSKRFNFRIVTPWGAVRLSWDLRIVMGLVFIGFFIVGGLGAIAGEYLRSSFVKVENKLWVRILEAERQRLNAENDRLAAELKNLQGTVTMVGDWDSTISDRLSKLAAILNGDSKLALQVSPPSNQDGSIFARIQGDRKGAVGGAENINCPKGVRCNQSLSSLSGGLPIDINYSEFGSKAEQKKKS